MTTTAIKYTSNATFTIPSGVSIIYVSMVAGGQAGSGAFTTYGGIGGTAGSAAINVPFPCTAGQVATIVVGAGGVGTSAPVNVGGQSGGDSSVTIGTSNVKSVGGSYYSTDPTWINSALGSPSFGWGGYPGDQTPNSYGALKVYGRLAAPNGNEVPFAPFSKAGGGGGGTSWLGKGGVGGFKNNNPYGAGAGLVNTGAGGGGGGVSSSASPGGNGGSGCVIIEY